MRFSKETRQRAIEKLQDRTLDLLVIGGGITGAGVALHGGELCLPACARA